MQRNRRFRRVKVTADGDGLVSRAGTALLRELTVDTGLAHGWSDVLLDTYKAFPVVHEPGRVLADLAVVIADGGDALAHLATLRDQDKLFGTVASDATAWRCVERVDDAHLSRVQAVRAVARERAWAAGAEPVLAGGLTIDIDATITIAHSEKENAASTWKKTFGLHPLLAYLDRPDVSGGEGLAGILRPGNAGSNTTADHVQILAVALAALPEYARPRPGAKTSPKVLVRTDSAGATYGFAAACHKAGCGFSLGFAIDEPVREAILALPEKAWSPAYDIDGHLRDGAWVAELTGLLDLAKWPADSRVIVRQQASAPRCAVAVHRHRRASVHRVHHRYQARWPATSARRPRSPAPQPRPSRRPHPLREGNRPAQPALQGLCTEPGLARTRSGRRRPADLDAGSLS